MKKLLPVILLVGLFGITPARAFNASGSGKVGLSPATSTLQTGTETPVDIIFNTANTAISGISIRLTFSVPATPDLQVVRVQPASLDGWTFNVNKIYTSGGKTTVDLMALNGTVAGYANNADTKLATITFKATAAFSGKAVTFDQTQTKMLKKSDASDILGTLGNGTYNATGATIQTTITPTATPTLTPTPTQSQQQQNTTPTPTPTPTPGQRQSFLDIVDRTLQRKKETVATPTEPPVPTIPAASSSQREIPITVNPFTNAAGEAAATFTLSGTTDLSATVSIRIQPDAVGGTTTADSTGYWEYRILRPLTSGSKELTVTAMNANGETGLHKETFTVQGTSPMGILPLIIALVLFGIVGIFLFLRLRKGGLPPAPPPAAPPIPPFMPPARS
ncbi:hypothetical protein HYV22_01475 [Candidatus Gottesmanbacteria bacterium]|nr:hypothetical protein [Candidatus Gottesmanbacteria bacterium]